MGSKPTTSPEMAASAPRTVLYIDEGISFGGALIVTAHLARYLDPSRYRAVVHSETSKEILRALFTEPSTVYPAKRAFDYMDWGRAMARIDRLPGAWTRRLATYCLSAWRTAANVPFYLRMAALVRRCKVDIIHHGNGGPRVFPTLLRKPLVSTVAGIWRAPLNVLQRYAVSRTARYVLISEVAYEGFSRSGGPVEVAEIIPNPCDPLDLPASERLPVRERYGLPAQAKVFGILGRIVPWKGQKQFVEAALRVLEDVPDACAVVVGEATDGDEPYLDEIRSIVERSPHGDRVRFLGYVQEVAELYNALDVAVHASISPEPFGLVVIEAMGTGVPIVAANSGGPLEIVDDGVDGFLVDPHDTEALAERVTRLLTDEELRSRMADRGRAKVAERYHAKRYAERIQDLYDALYEQAK